MSIDIICVIEVVDESSAPWPWARLKLPRDYELFSAIAGVRSQPGEHHLFPPRGLPAIRSYVVHDYCFLQVVEDADVESPLNRGENVVPRSTADQWVRDGLANYIPNAYGVQNGFVSNKEWHTHSWLTLAELSQALDYAGLSTEDRSPEFRAALVAMDELSKTYGRDSVRLVFWFCN